MLHVLLLVFTKVLHLFTNVLQIFVLESKLKILLNQLPFQQFTNNFIKTNSNVQIMSCDVHCMCLNRIWTYDKRVRIAYCLLSRKNN